jgi:hypothetical protein
MHKASFRTCVALVCMMLAGAAYYWTQDGATARGAGARNSRVQPQGQVAQPRADAPRQKPGPRDKSGRREGGNPGNVRGFKADRSMPLAAVRGFDPANA